MEDGKLLAQCESQDVTVPVILGKDFPESRAQDTSPAPGSIAVDDLEHGDSLPLAATHLQEQAALGFFKRGQTLLDGEGAERGHERWTA